MSLELLQAFAVSSNKSKAVWTLTIEQARDEVQVVDGNKKPLANGNQELPLKLGKYVLALDAVKKGATRIDATADNVEHFTDVLLTSVLDGAFDEAIKEAQEKSRAQYKKQTKKFVEEGKEPEGE